MAQVTVPDSGLTVRMYRPGFGDCFLLTFRTRQNNPFHMLIDCGVHSQWQGGSDRIREVAENISEATGGHLHVVVVTHEHGDHVSGFYLARKTFQNMQIDEVWLAWTEDPKNILAQRLDRKRSLMMHALRATERYMAADSPAAKNVLQLMHFFELSDEALGISTRQARDVIRERAKHQQYLKPKAHPLTLPEVDGVRIFVLGPPEDEQALMDAAPTGKPGEVYEDDPETGIRLSSDDALAVALLAASHTSLEADVFFRAELYQPFAGNRRLQADVVKARPDIYKFFHEYYGFDDADNEKWRRIDLDWQNSVESLALKLDSATNNSSLVLAIELMNSKRVLLFAGDAQVGNWKSWHEGEWSHKNGLMHGERITAEDLLRRTVLYKVGHHGSHNATLRRQGLEMMTSKELVAMIPVDKKWAMNRKPNPWKMPFGPLEIELREHTRGRILRSDIGWDKTGLNTQPDWGDFRQCVEDLYIELHIPDEKQIG
jgi:hypothetical protein